MKLFLCNFLFLLVQCLVIYENLIVLVFNKIILSLKLFWSLFIFLHYVVPISLLSLKPNTTYNIQHGSDKFSKHDSRSSVKSLQHCTNTASRNQWLKNFVLADSLILSKWKLTFCKYQVWKASWLFYVWRNLKKAMTLCHEIMHQASRKWRLILHRAK